MPRRSRSAFALLLALALGATTARAAPETARAPPPEDGAVAPVGAWYTAGGCAARTSAAATRPLVGPLVRGWEATLPGEIESEPLVWDQNVVVSVRTAEARRSLVVLALATGKTLHKKTFETEAPLEPALWKRLVVVRSAPSRLEVLAIGERELTSRWRFDHPAGARVSAPLLFGEELYVRAGEGMERLHIGRPAPIWRRGGVRSDPCLRGRHVYVVEYESRDGGAHLAALDRETGEGERLFVGQHVGRAVPAETESAGVVAFAEDLFVRHARPVLTADDRAANDAWVERSRGRLVSRGLVDFAGPPVAAGDAWMALMADDEEGRTLNVLAGKDGPKHRFEVLASDRLHPEFARLEVPPTVLGAVVYVGGRAFDRESKRILRAEALPARFRGVPARGALLLADGTRLVAWREERAPAPVSVAWSPDVATLAAGVAVLSDGTVQPAPLSFDPASKTVSPGARPKARPGWPLDDVALALDAEGRVVHAQGAEEIAAAVEALSSRDLAKGFLDLAVEAGRRGDAESLAEAVAEARAHGASEADLVAPTKRLAALEKARGRVDPAARAKALGAAAEVLARAARRLWDVVAALPETSPFPVRADLVRRVLDADPAHAGAAAWVRARLPEGLVLPEPFDAREWLEFAEAIGQTPIRLVPPPKPGDRDLTYAQRELGSARHFWRPDVVGLQSGQLLVLTPLRQPGQVARCLSTGEVVCDALESLFRSGARRRDVRYPLILRLHETQEEYLEQSQRSAAGRSDSAGLEWTSGHYSPEDGFSRIFLPSRPDAFESVMHTYAHELTHHWIEERCPCFAANERAGGASTPGYWVVEGIATFVEEFRLDRRERTFDPRDPKAASLDVVGNVDPKALVPWPALFDLSHREFGALDREPKIQVPTRWSLGLYRVLSRANLFYSQSAAACQYLHHAEGGRFRDAIVGFVSDHYSGRARPGHVRARLGMSPEELGDRIVRWAKEGGR